MVRGAVACSVLFALQPHGAWLYLCISSEDAAYSIDGEKSPNGMADSLRQCLHPNPRRIKKAVFIILIAAHVEKLNKSNVSDC